uniref:Histidine-specific methyltransferase SAM-dependent domain-containing protein n=1 Tax=Branchiostoma floridae TaxID=7739 RepID=C3Z3H7_BRAFL|eukprot:XP_002597009.1 hypothetical protein BRAFLDRAFT_76503 [Branchiostoma floridae]
MNKMAFENTVNFVENPADGDTPSYVQQYLRSSTNQRVHLRKLDVTIDFLAGERLYLAEGQNYSCKYSEHQVRRLAELSNFAVEGFWVNEEAKYCVGAPLAKADARGTLSPREDRSDTTVAFLHQVRHQGKFNFKSGTLEFLTRPDTWGLGPVLT